MAFNTILLSIFYGFGLRKRLQNRGFFAFVSKTLIFWKLAKTIEKPMVFHDLSDVRGPKNSYIDEKAHSKKALQNNLPRIDVGVHFGFP